MLRHYHHTQRSQCFYQYSVEWSFPINNIRFRTRQFYCMPFFEWICYINSYVYSWSLALSNISHGDSLNFSYISNSISSIFICNNSNKSAVSTAITTAVYSTTTVAAYSTASAATKTIVSTATTIACSIFYCNSSILNFNSRNKSAVSTATTTAA